MRVDQPSSTALLKLGATVLLCSAEPKALKSEGVGATAGAQELGTGSSMRSMSELGLTMAVLARFLHETSYSMTLCSSLRGLWTEGRW